MKDRVKIDDGYVIIARKIMDSSIWNADPEILKLFLYLICKARHKSKPKQFPNKIKVKRGELLTSYQNIINDNEFMKGKSVIRWSKGKLSRMLEKLEKKGTIKRLEDTHGTHIRVVHYGKYQNPENYKICYHETVPSDTGSTVKQSQKITETNNKVNKEKNVKNEKKITKYKTLASFTEKLEYSNSGICKSPSTSTEDEGPQPWRHERWTKFDYNLSKKVLVYQNKQFPKVVSKDEESIRKGANTIRLIRKDGKLTKEEILEALRFGVKDKRFWHDKILSVSNLRHKSKRNGKMKIINIYKSWQEAQRVENEQKKKKKSTREIMKEAMDE